MLKGKGYNYFGELIIYLLFFIFLRKKVINLYGK